LIVASFVFYAYWDWRLYGLVVISSLIDWIGAKYIFREASDKNRKRVLIVSIIANVSILVYYKYSDLFISLVNAWGSNLFDFRISKLVLPLGISFYTLQSMSYSIDIYQRKYEPTESFISYFTFVSFFPQLIAGPILRAQEFIPQLEKKYQISWINIQNGCFRVLLGLAMKVIVADRCAIYVNEIFGFPDQYNSAGILLANFLFAIQLYTDFAAYSHIAIGSALLLNLNLAENFKTPWLASSLQGFWQRWHISLGSWLRDYLYLPLGGKKRFAVASMLVFLISGLWHGANWTFVAWGAFHGIGLLIERYSPIKLPRLIRWCFVQGWFVLSMIFFRSESISDLRIMVLRFWDTLYFIPNVNLNIVLGSVILFLIVDYLLSTKHYTKPFKSYWTNTIVYSFLIIMVFLFNTAKTNSFIYFQF
jgi:D-alanyl-lipoteichoic acid acyltransferase DltB (MBOAT superfamily)